MAYVLGITRVDPIRHELLFERFINEGRTAYPDVDIDFSSERREEVIQYVYERYGTEHTGMVCNLVTYRARSAVREVGYALGFPRPLVDRVAKALETYDSVMVRRDLEAEGGFAGFFARPGDAAGEAIGADAVRGARRLVAEVAVAGTASLAAERGLTDAMGQLNHARGGRYGGDLAAEHGDGRQARRGDGEQGGERSGGGERWLGGDESDRWLRRKIGELAPGDHEDPVPAAEPGHPAPDTTDHRGRRENPLDRPRVRRTVVETPESAGFGGSALDTTMQGRGWGTAEVPGTHSGVVRRIQRPIAPRDAPGAWYRPVPVTRAARARGARRGSVGRTSATTVGRTTAGPRITAGRATTRAARATPR